MGLHDSRIVVRVITRLNIGGPAIQALTLTRELSEDFPTALLAGVAPPEEGELADARVPVERVPLVREVNPVRDLLALAAVRRSLRRYRPRIVHTHMAKAGAVGRLAAKLVSPRPKTIHTFHGHVLQGYFGPVVRESFLHAERVLAKQTDALVAVSPEIRDELLSLDVGRPDQWRVIPLGFDLSPFIAVGEPRGRFRRSLGVAPDVPLVGILGRLAPVKDHRMLFDAIARIPGAHVAVLGDGELRTALESRASEPDVRGRIHFAGWVRDVPSALSDLDVVAVSSVSEGTPVSLIEALASARAVVSTDVGGVRSVVDDGQTGFLVERDPEALARQIEFLLADDDLRARFGERGRERMLQRFSQDRLLSDIRSLYEDLAS